MADGLADFLLARIAEDEAECRREIADGYGGDQHGSGWSSNRVLAECDARQRIVIMYLGSRSALDRQTDLLERAILEAINESHADTLKPLALPYADHPDYSEEWRP